MSEYRVRWTDAQAVVQNLQYWITTPDTEVAMNKANQQARTAMNKLQNAESYVALLENQLDLRVHRWQESSPEYQTAKDEMAHQMYRKTLNDLERLVVQRLFELSKLNMSGTGKSYYAFHIAC